ncbi:MAG: cytochrome c oxidase assembly protein [Actinomycetota bacterium]|nr:cytochrome c oxidase assembly protein [Actinomycetota bacterium]
MNSGSFLTSWTFDPYITVLAGLPTIAFFMGKRLYSAKDASAQTANREIDQTSQPLFLVGVAILVIATMSPINHFSHIYLWTRILQSLLLIAYGPALIAMSAPWSYLRVGFAIILRRNGGADSSTSGNKNPIWRFLSVPLVAFIIYNAAMVMWLVPSSISFVERYTLANEAMHISLVMVGLLLWIHLVDSPPFQPRVAPLIKRVVPTYFTVVISWVFAMVLGFANAPFYHVYMTSANSLSPMADQEIASAILFIIVGGPFVYAGVNNTRRWMASENEYRDKPKIEGRGELKGGPTPNDSKKKRKIPGLT